MKVLLCLLRQGTQIIAVNAMKDSLAIAVMRLLFSSCNVLNIPVYH